LQRPSVATQQRNIQLVFDILNAPRDSRLAQVQTRTSGDNRSGFHDGGKRFEVK
jgi:hypothetical protein